MQVLFTVSYWASFKLNYLTLIKLLRKHVPFVLFYPKNNFSITNSMVQQLEDFDENKYSICQDQGVTIYW